VNYARLARVKRRVEAEPATFSFAALAEEYRRAGRHRDAIALCRAGLERHPSDVCARVTLGRALAEIGAYDEARSELEQVLLAAPENTAARNGLAEMHRLRSELAAAGESAGAGTTHVGGPGAPGDTTSQPNPAPHVHTDGDRPALAGLEEFLRAILRARRGRD
jgi:predicted Zn-dependent protease